jgi:predicted ATPase
MKLQVKNLGIIRNATIDLKPMTIFVGPNNSGKTLLAYVLLAIFGQVGLERYKNVLTKDIIANLYSPISDTIQHLVNEGNAKIDLREFADRYAGIYINDVAYKSKNWLKEFMNVERFSFDELEIEIILEETKGKLLEYLLALEINEGISLGRRRDKPLISATKGLNDPILYFYTSDSLDDLPEEAINAFVTNQFFNSIHRGLFYNTRAFPTERTTLIPLISSMIVDIENSAKKSFTKNRNKMSAEDTTRNRVNGPLSNFLEMMLMCHLNSLEERSTEIANNPLINRYNVLSQVLQKDILGGDLDYSLEKGLKIARELLFAPKQDVVLEMNIVSSMVKELAPLVLYLRYIAKPQEWLIIDEPEMNLHPEAQVRLTELLAMLVNADLSLLFTTHSPYFVDHLVNLIKAYDYEDKEAIKEKFWLGQTEAFISKQNVAVYLIDQGVATNILEEDGVIAWETFSKVSDRLSQIYFEL